MARPKTQAEKEQQAREQQLASATGNKPGESKKGGNDNQPQPLQSASEMEQQGSGQQRTVNNPIQQVQTNLPLHQSVETKNVTRTADYQGPQFNTEKFNEEEAYKKAQEHTSLKKLNELSKEQEELYRTRSEDATRRNKYNAWGNLLMAFGKLAGGGKQTYVKPDQKYLTESMKQAQTAKDLYDKAKLTNKAAYQKKLDEIVEAQKKLFYENQEKHNEREMKLAGMRQKDAHANKVNITTTNTYNNDDELAKKRYNLDYAKFQHQKDKDAKKEQQDKLNRAGKVQKDAFFTYEDSSNKKGYAMTASQAGRLASIMSQPMYERYFDEKALAMLKMVTTGQIDKVDKVQFAQIADRFIRDHRGANYKDAEIEDLLNVSTHYDLNPKDAPTPKVDIDY